MTNDQGTGGQSRRHRSVPAKAVQREEDVHPVACDGLVLHDRMAMEEESPARLRGPALNRPRQNPFLRGLGERLEGRGKQLGLPGPSRVSKEMLFWGAEELPQEEMLE